MGHIGAFWGIPVLPGAHSLGHIGAFWGKMGRFVPFSSSTGGRILFRADVGELEMDGTTAVVDRLRDQGFDVCHGYVQYLIRDRIVPSPPKGPGGVLLWEPSDVQRLRSELLRRRRGPAAAPIRRQQ